MDSAALTAVKSLPKVKLCFFLNLYFNLQGREGGRRKEGRSRRGKIKKMEKKKKEEDRKN